MRFAVLNPRPTNRRREDSVMRSSDRLRQDSKALADHLARVLDENGRRQLFLTSRPVDTRTASAVLVMLGQMPAGGAGGGGPCLILNKRSAAVRQPGDLCCPGGSLAARTDGVLAHLIRLPFLPLGRWPHWRRWKRRQPAEARMLSLLLATGLRESIEEMRLNPFGVRFLGPLPPYRLHLFQRKIYPMVGWVSGCQRFRPNWEVEKIVRLPLSELLNAGNYYRYRLHMADLPGHPPEPARDLPCFRHRNGSETETLWGATYRIAMELLEAAFGFEPPPLEGLPVIPGRLKATYLTGG